MTHEQKPESPEPRTREEQVASLGRMVASGILEKAGHTFRTRYLSEQLAAAEARGAAEQRRKDAEGAVAWVDPTFLPSSDYPWTDARLLLEDGTKGTIPLYSRPANVAALEARVKELEAEKLANEGAAFERGFQGGRRDRYKQYERETAEAVAAEREKIANKLDEVAKHLARPWGSYLTEEGIAVKEACAARVEQEAAAIREGGV